MIEKSENAGLEEINLRNNMNLNLFDTQITQCATETGRISHDFYPTPEGLTRSLLTACPQLPNIIFEPCAGNGAISDVLRKSGKKVFEWDIQWPRHGAYDPPLNACDATDRYFWWYWPKNNADGEIWAAVTNPPFALAHQILPLAYEHSSWGCAFLLRLSYLEPAENRAKWLQAHADNLRYIIPVNPRPKFKRNSKSTDSSTVAWMVWQKSWSWQDLGISCPFVFCDWWKNA